MGGPKIATSSDAVDFAERTLFALTFLCYCPEVLTASVAGAAHTARGHTVHPAHTVQPCHNHTATHDHTICSFPAHRSEVVRSAVNRRVVV